MGAVEGAWLVATRSHYARGRGTASTEIPIVTFLVVKVHVVNS